MQNVETQSPEEISPELSSEQPDLTEGDRQHILQVGEAASQMLGNPVYDLAYRLRIQDLNQEIWDSEPHEKNRREGLYMEMRGMRDQAGKFGQFVLDAQRILEEQRQENDPDRQEQERLDGQGFGIKY